MTEVKNNLSSLIDLFSKTHHAMQNHAVRSVDLALVVRNWLFGWYIIEFENGGAERTELYGKKLINTLSLKLKQKEIKGSSPTNLRKYREFYQSYSEIQQTPSVISDTTDKKNQQTLSVTSFLNTEKDFIQSPTLFNTLAKQFKLGWSHYVTLLTIRSKAERQFYEKEAIANSWSIRELKRQISSSLYERLALSSNKKKVKALSEKGHLIESAEDVIKNPYVLEFLNLPEYPHYSEHELETAIINKLERFLLELGKGFLFEARQKRFTFDDDHFYVDLVFYNRILQSYVLIDLKRDKLTHQDLGQMQMYVNYFDRYVKMEHESPTIGIVLCHSKNDSLVELTLPTDNNIHASEYQLYLPNKEELKKQLEEVQREWEQHHNNVPE